MRDSDIISLYLERDEAAIEVTKQKYGGYCFSIAYNILSDREDSEEALNDTYLGVWNSIPPHKPSIFSFYIAKITRNISLKKLRSRTAKKRISVTEELFDCIPDNEDVDASLENKELSSVIDAFLTSLKKEERIVFLRRYFFFDPISDIAQRMGWGESKVKMQLSRTRQKLKTTLEKEDIYL